MQKARPCADTRHLGRFASKHVRSSGLCIKNSHKIVILHFSKSPTDLIVTKFGLEKYFRNIDNCEKFHFNSCRDLYFVEDENVAFPIERAVAVNTGLELPFNLQSEALAISLVLFTSLWPALTCQFSKLLKLSP